MFLGSYYSLWNYMSKKATPRGPKTIDNCG